MSPQVLFARAGLTVRRLDAARLLEFVSFRAVESGDLAHLPRDRGGAGYSARNWTLVMHFAPGRWLILLERAGDDLAFKELERTGRGVLVDVSGGYVPLMLEGTLSERALASALDLGTVLVDRACAAVSGFDCPGVLVRLPQRQGLLWLVQASYVTAAVECLRGLELAGAPAGSSAL